MRQNHLSRQKPCPRARQQGAVLATALIFLVMLTLIGVTTTQNSTLEQKMASNLQLLNQAFHGAESGVAAALSNANATLLDSSDPVTYDITDIPGLTIATETVYLAEGNQPPPGYSLSGQFTSHYFYVDSVATTDAGNASTHQQGFYIVGPNTDSSD